MIRTSLVVSIAGVIFAAASFSRASVLTDFTYLYDAGGSGPYFGYGDGDNVPPHFELNDDQLAIGTSFSDPRWVGFEDTTISGDAGTPQPQVNAGFAAPHDFESLTITYDVEHNVVIYAPDSVTVRFSNDNVTFADSVSFTSFDDTNGNHSTTFDLTGHSGQYVQVALFNDREWTFLSEIDFTSVPEPASLGVIGFAAAGMLSRRNRRAVR